MTLLLRAGFLSLERSHDGQMNNRVTGVTLVAIPLAEHLDWKMDSGFPADY
jgi:hypothetical protein